LGGQLGEVSGGSPVHFGDRVGIVPKRGRAAAAVAEAGSGVAQIEAAGEELAGGVVPSALDIELHSGGGCGLGDLVCGLVRVPWPGVGRIVREQVRVIE